MAACACVSRRHTLCINSIPALFHVIPWALFQHSLRMLAIQPLPNLSHVPRILLLFHCYLISASAALAAFIRRDLFLTSVFPRSMLLVFYRTSSVPEMWFERFHIAFSVAARFDNFMSSHLSSLCRH